MSNKSIFEPNDEQYLLRLLSRNDVVLFLGAGFSTLATNGLNNNLPTGGELAKHIWNFLGYKKEEYDFTSLQDMYQALLSSGKSEESISQFLHEHFFTVPNNIPEEYKYITIPFWYKIYTLNIDNILSNIYNKVNKKFDLLYYPHEEHKERDQSLVNVQIIHLNGKLGNKPSSLIFSTKQYAKASLDYQPLYQQFIQDYATKPIIFIGTTISEPIFEQYLSAREARGNFPENRPKSFLITPNISPVKENLLKTDYNIVTIKANTVDFLLWLNTISQLLPSKESILQSLYPSLSRIEPNTIRPDQQKFWFKFAENFRIVPKDYKPTNSRSSFLLGASPTWDDIHKNLDAQRPLTQSIFDFVNNIYNEKDNELKIVALLGNGGSGKSTILKRLGLNLSQFGRTVFISYSEYIPKLDTLQEALNLINERVVLLFDNAELIAGYLPKITEALQQVKNPPILVLATRLNSYERLCSNLEPIISIKEFEIQNLIREEIVQIINILDRENLLGILKGKIESERIRAFEQKAKKQLLVAMREATKGLNFNDIIRDEFNGIDSIEAKILCVCAALTTELGFTVSIQEFVGFSNASPSEALFHLNKTLKGIIIPVGVKQDKFIIRHRTIAEFIVDNCAEIEMLKEAYIRILSVLAMEIKSGSFSSRTFNIYRELINHKKIYKRFKEDIENARSIFDKISIKLNSDFHFWLQYGSLESEGKGGNLQLAENYLNQANSIKEGNYYYKNAMGNLLYKKACDAKLYSDAFIIKQEANELILSNIKYNGSEDAHCYHIYCSGNYSWINKWITNEASKKSDEYSKLLKIAKTGIIDHPKNRRLQELYSIINKGYLLTGINNESLDSPIDYESL